MLSSSRGLGNFRGLEASRPRTWKCVLEAKDVLLGLHLCCLTIIKVNLHCIRFSYVFVRFCFLKKFALFHPHFYKSISALSRLLYIGKNFVQKFCVRRIRAIFQYRAVPLCKKFFRKRFVQYVTVWLVRIWTYKNADEKAHTFSRRSKNGRKTDTV